MTTATPGNQPYNYERFVGDDDFESFRACLPVGSRAPDGVVLDARNGAAGNLSNYWRGRDVVIEFGSLT